MAIGLKGETKYGVMVTTPGDCDRRMKKKTRTRSCDDCEYG